MSAPNGECAAHTCRTSEPNCGFMPCVETLAHALWQRQVAALDTCRRMAPKVLLALEDIGQSGGSGQS